MNNGLKSIVFVLLCFAVLCFVFPCFSENGNCGENVQWSLDESGILTITGSGPMTDYNDVLDTPWYDVRERIKSVVFGEGITHVGDCTFAESESLVCVKLSNTVESIGNYAFNECRLLRSSDNEE